MIPFGQIHQSGTIFSYSFPNHFGAHHVRHGKRAALKLQNVTRPWMGRASWVDISGFSGQVLPDVIHIYILSLHGTS